MGHGGQNRTLFRMLAAWLVDATVSHDGPQPRTHQDFGRRPPVNPRRSNWQPREAVNSVTMYVSTIGSAVRTLRVEADPDRWIIFVY